MTTIDELSASIIADARAQAAQIEEEERTALNQISEQTTLLLNKERERLYAAAKQEEEQAKARLEAKQQLELMQATLRAKQELIEDVFRTAEQALHAMPTSKRKKLLNHLWLKAKGEFSVGKIIAAKKDASFFRGKGKVQSVAGLGGFVAESKDGTMSIDMRFETLLADIKARKTADVAKTLFGATQMKSSTKSKPAKKSKSSKKPSKAKRKR